MGINKQSSRIKHHTSTTSGSFTVPASEDFTDGSWDKWDLAKSEIAVNDADDTVFIRVGSNIRQIYPQGASTGVYGISNGSGEYTFYTTIALANASATSGDVVEFFADVEETGATEWILKDGVNYNLNGHTYTLNNAGTSDAVTDNNVAVNCTIFNGTIKRTGGTANDSNSIGLHIDSTTSDVTLKGVVIKNDFGVATRTDGILRGGSHYGETKGVIVVTASSSFSNGYVYGDTSVGITCYGVAYNVRGESNTGIGANFFSSSEVQNSSFYSASSYGVKLNGVKAFNISSVSDGNYGGYCNTGTNVLENCSFYSTANHAWVNTSSTYVRMMNCSGYSTAGQGLNHTSSLEQTLKNNVGISTTDYGIFFTDSGSDEFLSGCHAESRGEVACFSTAGKIYNCTFVCDWNDANGHAYECNTVSIAPEIVGCSFNVTNASANCLSAPNAKSTYLVNNIYGSTSTTPVNANITNLQTNTPDAYGNIQIG